MFVTDQDNKRLGIFDSDRMDFTDLIHLGELNPTGICSTPRGQILVTTSQGIVLILDANGKIIDKFGSKSTSNGQFSNPRGICCNSSGNEILIVDSDNHRIQVFSQDGQFLTRFGSLGKDADQFCYPMAVCTDWQDNILVTDCSNCRISVFSSERIPIQQIPFVTPFGLCLAGDNRLIVTSLDNSIGIFSN